MLMPAVLNARHRKRFCLILVKPTHYDDDGYVIQWFRSAIPSNSLACVYGLARDIADRRALGEEVDFDIHALDESNTRVRPHKLAKMIRAADAGMVMLVGVQSNQTPRALDIARPLREMGIQVGIGGFHMSGVISMIDGDDAALREAQALGLSIFAGEAEEGRLEEVLRDAYAGTLKPLYNFMKDLPGIEGVPIPFLGRERVTRTAGAVTSFDAGRGCPFQCSFCTIINVQGRVSRRRSPEDVEKIVRDNIAQGLSRFFITDDNFARNKDWESILDRLIYLREVEHMDFSFIIQVDTLCHRTPNFIEKCQRAGVKRVFIGLENINPENLAGAKKKQNKITEYRKMLLAWHGASILTYAGYIIGFPGDTEESVAREIELIKRELPIDILEFFYLTPLPGSEDHQKLHRAGVAMDPDLNKYDLFHITTAHPRMSAEEWQRTYQSAWKSFYSTEHVTTVMRRAAALHGFGATLFAITWFKCSIEIENVHPLESGFLRMKFRGDRRPSLPREPAYLFYPKFVWETLSKNARWISTYLRLRRIYLSIKNDPKRKDYRDLAISPVEDDETETREMFQSNAAQAYVSEERRLKRVREGEAAA